MSEQRVSLPGLKARKCAFLVLSHLVLLLLYLFATICTPTAVVREKRGLHTQLTPFLHGMVQTQVSQNKKVN